MKRSFEPELIDLGHYTLKEYQECLDELALVGKLTGGNRATLKAFERLKAPPASILDVGCGGGEFAKILSHKYPDCQVVGIDPSQEAIQWASQKESPNLRFYHSSLATFSAPPFDVVTATLVCHHLNDDELVLFLKKAFSLCRKSVIINDLHRHILAKVGYKIISPLLFSNRLIIQDGQLSINKGFKKSEWKDLLSRAGLRGQISWHWLFRHIIIINKEP